MPQFRHSCSVQTRPAMPWCATASRRLPAVAPTTVGAHTGSTVLAAMLYVHLLKDNDVRWPAHAVPPAAVVDVKLKGTMTCAPVAHRGWRPALAWT